MAVTLGGFIATPCLAGTAAEAKTVSGCPAGSGYSLMTVESLKATGNFPAPRLVDDAGNADGCVCARPYPHALCLAQDFDPCPVDVVYKYKDNSVR